MGTGVSKKVADASSFDRDSSGTVSSYRGATDAATTKNNASSEILRSASATDMMSETKLPVSTTETERGPNVSKLNEAPSLSLSDFSDDNYDKFADDEDSADSTGVHKFVPPNSNPSPKFGKKFGDEKASAMSSTALTHGKFLSTQRDILNDLRQRGLVKPQNPLANKEDKEMSIKEHLMGLGILNKNMKNCAKYSKIQDSLPQTLLPGRTDRPSQFEDCVDTLNLLDTETAKEEADYLSRKQRKDLEHYNRRFSTKPFPHKGHDNIDQDCVSGLDQFHFKQHTVIHMESPANGIHTAGDGNTRSEIVARKEDLVKSMCELTAKIMETERLIMDLEML